MTAGAKLPGAPNPLQSHEVLVNGKLLKMGEDGSLPNDQLENGARGSGELTLPPRSYAFVRYATDLALCR